MLTSGLEQYLLLCSADSKCQDRLWIFVVSFKCLTCKNVQMQSGNDKEEEDSKITKTKKAVFRECGLDLPLGEGSQPLPPPGLPSRTPFVEGSTFQGPSALHQHPFF